MAEVIHGGADGNQLNASANKTQVYGLKGNDTLISDGKSDVLLVGGSGDDSLIMFGGNGTLSGGKGSDTFELTYSADKKLSAVIEDFEPSSDRIVVNHVGDTAPQLTSSVKGNDVIWTDGGNFNLTLKSVRENDYFDGDAPDEAWEVLRLTNVEREAKGLPPLTLSEGLTAGASIRVKEINGLAQTGALSNHTRPNGKGEWDTVLEGKYIHPGENLDGGASSPVEVMGHWMGSTSHRDNILDKNFLKLGVGYNYDDTDSSNHRWYWTQLFADSLKSVETVSLDNLSVAQVNPVSKSVAGDAAANTLSNANYGATIDALDGNDSISNSGLIASISGGNGVDTITNSGAFTTICAGLGNDLISLAGDAKENLIQYATGDGNDTIQGFRADSTLSISGDEFTPVTVGSDVIVSVGTDSITLGDAASLSAINIDGTRSKLYILTESNDSITNTVDGATLVALGGNDWIQNGLTDSSVGANASISGGAGDDTLRNFASLVTIDAGAGADDIFNRKADVTVLAGAGNDSINNWQSDSAVIDAGDGNDSIQNMENDNVSINAGAGSDTIDNSLVAKGATIDGGAGNDSIHNFLSDSVSIAGGTGDDTITNSSSDNVLFIYNAGDDNDYIKGFDETSTLSIAGGSYVRSTVNNDIVLAVGEDSITLEGAARLSTINIIGEGSEGISVDNRYVLLTNDNDTYSNTVDGAFIQSYAGDDTIVNDGASVIIYAGEDDDTISNNGSDVTINAGAGNDQISLGSSATKNLIRYRAGDGNDLIRGFNATDKLEIENVTSDCSTQVSGSDIVINVGTGAITLAGAARLSTVNIAVNWSEPRREGNLITLSESNDHYRNKLDGVTIAALGGNDDIGNAGTNVSISGGAGNDGIGNESSNVTIDAGAGNDNISNYGSNVTIDGGDGNDEIFNWSDGTNSTVDAGAGDDDISNQGSKVSIDAGVGNDSIRNGADGSFVTIDGGIGDDTVDNSGESVTILGGAGNDTIKNGIARIGIHNEDGTLSFVDSIVGGDSVLIDLGAGNDSIYNGGSYVTINGGAGNDRISLLSGAKNNVIEYTEGDGLDTVWGYDNTTSLKIGDGSGTYSQTVSGDDLIILVGDGSITLKDAREKPSPIILGESGTKGGGSGSEGDNDASGSGKSSKGNGGNSSGNDGNSGKGGNTNNSSNTGDNNNGGNVNNGSNISNGINSSANNGDSYGVNSGTSASSNINTGGSINTNSGTGGYNSTDYRRSSSTSTPFEVNPFDLLKTQTNSATNNQHVYTGGNQVISDYQAGEKIIFGAAYTGALFDDANNFFVGSTTGAIVVTNAADKVIDLTDGTGNSFLKAYAATAAGIIDGRGLSGFEVIKGSAGADIIFAGDGSSSLWGGNGIDSDTLVGGGGIDIFVGGKNQGADIILNASATDVVFLSDSTLSDILASAEGNGAVAVAFNTGNVIAVQSTEPLSAAFMLADGSAYRYNHVAKTWQTA